MFPNVGNLTSSLISLSQLLILVNSWTSLIHSKLNVCHNFSSYQIVFSSFWKSSIFFYFILLILEAFDPSNPLNIANVSHRHYYYHVNHIKHVTSNVFQVYLHFNTYWIMWLSLFSVWLPVVSSMRNTIYLVLGFFST